MKKKTPKIDHIVYAVPNLEEGIFQIEEKLGIRPVYGGQHLTEGTHNALLNLGNECYLELLAIDHSNKNVTANRWMGIDLIDEPMITRWALKSNTLNEDLEILKNVNPLLAKSKDGMRQKEDGSILNWELSIPLPTPKVEVIPFLIDWKNSVHPTATLQNSCQLKSINFSHPNPETIQPIYDAFYFPKKPVHQMGGIKKERRAKISILIQSPNGLVEL